MHASAVLPSRAASAASSHAEIMVSACERDGQYVSIPRPETQLIVRFGPSARRGLDAHALGVRHTAHRKLLRRGQHTVTARLRLGSTEAVLGATAAALSGRIVPLEDLWGDASTERLLARLADARDPAESAGILEDAITERLTHWHGGQAELTLDAAARLGSAPVSDVALELGVSERHLRRVFRDAVGLSPKAFAKLRRFHRALRVARAGGDASWGRIAVEAGYYDQAHLIAEFRAIAGVTPRALLSEILVPPLTD